MAPTTPQSSLWARFQSWRLRRQVTFLRNAFQTERAKRGRQYSVILAGFRYLGTQGSRHGDELRQHDQQLRELVAQVAALVDLNRQNPARAREYERLYAEHLALVMAVEDASATTTAETETPAADETPPMAAAGGGT